LCDATYIANIVDSLAARV